MCEIVRRMWASLVGLNSGLSWTYFPGARFSNSTNVRCLPPDWRSGQHSRRAESELVPKLNTRSKDEDVREAQYRTGNPPGRLSVYQ
jgi:hypothetical protein